MKKYYKYNYLALVFTILAVSLLIFSMYTVPITTNERIYNSHFTFYTILSIGMALIGLIFGVHARNYMKVIII